MRQRIDGSIQSGNTPTPQNISRREDFGLYRCMVTKTIFTDGDNLTQNAANPRVLYDVIVLGGFASGQIISNCRLASDLGGLDNYFERVLRPSSKDPTKIKLQDHDGDIVYVQYVQGHTGSPVIVGLDNGIKTTGKIGATKEDGYRWLRQYNGIKEQITKDGVYTFVRTGGELQEDGLFKPNDAEQYKREHGKNEKLIETFFSGMKRETDGKEDVYTRTYKGGLEIKEDGKNDKVTITTAGGVIVEIDGKGGKITLTKGSTIIELDGNGDKISLKGGFVDLGSSVSDFAVLFTELLTAFNTHTHNAPQAPAGVIPTTPPLAPMLQTVGSTTVKVQP